MSISIKTSLWMLIAGLGLSAEPAHKRNAAAPNSEMHASIRSGDLVRMQMLLAGGADPNSVDEQGTPALMNAALFGDTKALRALLDRGANPNAKDPAGATALIWAANDAEKARILIEAGADVNARSLAGRTPLLVAAATAGGAETVRLLLSRGATVDTRDNLDSMPVLMTGGGKATPLIEAGRNGDLSTIRMLLDKGAQLNARDSHNGSVLSEAVLYGRRDVVKLLLEKGATFEDRLTVAQYPILTLAAVRGDAAIAKMLIAAGADVNARDNSGATPLMWATNADRDTSEIVKVFLKAGAAVNARDKAGETALDWALRRGDTPVAHMLRSSGATAARRAGPADSPAYRDDADLLDTLSILGRSGETALKKAACASCHNHTLPLVAFAAAKRNGMPVDEQAEKKMMAGIFAMLKPAVPILLEGSDVVPDLAVTGSYVLEALSAQNHPTDRLTTAIVHNVAMKQAADGRWVGWSPRYPLEAGDIQATALAIRSLRLYTIPGRRAELDTRVQRAAMWLRSATPQSTEDYVMKLLGLHWANSPAAEVQSVARQLMTLQRKDGGWGQMPGLPADAYATAKAIYALRGAVGRERYPETIARGLNYLRRTQHTDGSWHVVTRAVPVQPMVDTGFPHGRDQWISAAATSWAAIVLSSPDEATTKRRAAPTKRVAERRAPRSSPASQLE